MIYENTSVNILYLKFLKMKMNHITCLQDSEPFAGTIVRYEWWDSLGADNEHIISGKRFAYLAKDSHGGGRRFCIMVDTEIMKQPDYGVKKPIIHHCVTNKDFKSYKLYVSELTSEEIEDVCDALSKKRAFFYLGDWYLKQL